MSKYVKVPIQAARDLAEEFDKDQVIVVTWDKAHGMMHVTTYGRSVEDCEQAAQGGNLIKRSLGFPEELCSARPERLKCD